MNRSVEIFEGFVRSLIESEVDTRLLLMENDQYNSNSGSYAVCGIEHVTLICV